MFRLSPVLVLWLAAVGSSAEMERVQIAEGGRGFVLAKSQQPFLVWGVNYDHDGEGKLLEDYWHTDWERVAADFAEMRKLGVNVVRIHLQFGRFMETADKPNQKELAQLQKLLALATEQQLYLDITGLGCYHKADVPPWYDKLDEAARWEAQANFWAAVAATCAEHPVVFCYDLMNEPVSPAGGDGQGDWLGPAFGGKHFVQRISLQQGERTRPEVAALWIAKLVAAIRKHDKSTLVTVGLVPWSLDRKGLTSGFVPEKIAGDLDFIAVHLYPEKDKLDEALETLKGFDVGKPVIIEEMFPLKCSGDELVEFVDRSRDVACGWVSFYWGQTPEELAAAKTFPAALTKDWLEKFEQHGKKILK